MALQWWNLSPCLSYINIYIYFIKSQQFTKHQTVRDSGRQESSTNQNTGILNQSKHRNPQPIKTQESSINQNTGILNQSKHRNPPLIKTQESSANQNTSILVQSKHRNSLPVQNRIIAYLRHSVILPWLWSVN